MDSDSKSVLFEIFLEAAKMYDSGARLAYLNQACGDNLELRQRVERLLAAEARAGGPPAEALPSAEISSDPALGSRVGHYKLLQPIGEGGCGIVFMAEQEQPVRRRVALKVIKLGMDTKQVVARFEAERQVLAMMDHPNIAQVFDAGTIESQISNSKFQIHGGRPYFVMELVRGIKITDFCDQHQFSTRQRLDLFIQVCHAVQHAHQKGIIHRDLKPSNILVTELDGVPLPKIIDFGIAKAVEGRLTDQTLFTAFEQFIGTPAYMSPEQATLTAADIDTRSDIYSLGVLLYELLTGKTPFETKGLLASGLDEMRRTIREIKPTRPSTRLTQQHAAKSQIKNQKSKIANDLDWIVMKCLEKDRGRRYETANDLATDVQRHLNNEPIIARPPSRLYEFQKTVRRHKFGFAATAAVILVLAAGLAGVFWQWRRAAANEWLARQNAYAADMNHAQQSLEEGDFGTALSLLNKYIPEYSSGGMVGSRSAADLRNWEWRYLWGLCRSDEQSTLCRYPTWVGGVAVSADGNVMAVQKGDGQIALWDLPGRHEITNLPASGFRGTIAFSSAGNLLAAANSKPGEEHEVSLWDMRNLKARVRLTHKAAVMALTFSRDGRFLATKDSMDVVRVWEIESRQVLTNFDAGGRGWASERFPSAGVLRFSPDGSQLAFQSKFSGIRVVNWRAGTNTLLVDPPAAAPSDDPLLGRITSMAFSPLGKLLAWSVGDGTIHLWDLVEGKSAGELTGHDNAVLSLAFTPDGQRLASASSDQTIRVWDLGDQRELRCLHGNENEVWALSFLPDGKTLVSGGKDGSVRLWDMTMSQRVPSPRVLPAILPQFTADGRQFLALDSPPKNSGLTVESISLWDSRSLKKTGTLPEFGTNNYCFRLSTNKQWFAVARRDETSVHIWDWHTRQVVTNLDVPERPEGVGFFPDGKTLYAVYQLGPADRTVGRVCTWKFWRTDSWEEIKVDWLKPNIWCGYYSPDGRLVAIGYETGKIELRTFPDGRLVVSFPGFPSRVQDVRFSPDGRMLAASSPGDFVKVWDVQTGKELMTLRSHFTQVCVEFSPDSRRLAVGGDSGGSSGPRVMVWDLATQRELITLIGAASNVTFSPDGNTLIARENSSPMWRIHVWQAPSWEEIEAAERSTSSR